MAHVAAASLHRPAAIFHRAVIAGSAWGLVMGAVLAAVSAWQCGGVCIPDAMMTTGLAMVAGICTLGPLAAFGPSARQN